MGSLDATDIGIKNLVLSCDNALQTSCDAGANSQGSPKDVVKATMRLTGLTFEPCLATKSCLRYDELEREFCKDVLAGVGMDAYCEVISMSAGSVVVNFRLETMDGGSPASDVFEAIKVAVSTGSMPTVADSAVDASSVQQTSVEGSASKSENLNLALLLALVIGITTCCVLAAGFYCFFVIGSKPVEEAGVENLRISNLGVENNPTSGLRESGGGVAGIVPGVYAGSRGDCPAPMPESAIPMRQFTPLPPPPAYMPQPAAARNAAAAAPVYSRGERAESYDNYDKGDVRPLSDSGSLRVSSGHTRHLFNERRRPAPIHGTAPRADPGSRAQGAGDARVIMITELPLSQFLANFANAFAEDGA